jgi:hypothetical protein
VVGSSVPFSELHRLIRARLLSVRYDGDDDVEDSSALRSLTDYLKEEEAKKKKEEKTLPADTPQYVVILFQALDNALDMVGRTGKDVLYTMLEERHGLKTTDVASKPGDFMSALRALLESSAMVIESYMLAYVSETTGVRGWSLEDAVDKLKAAN